MGATAGRPILSLNAPVIRQGEAVGLVNMAIEPNRLSAVLRSRLLPQNWVAALVDGAGKVVARSRSPEQFIGQTATVDLLENTTGQQGTWAGTTKEGTPVLSAYARSSLSGWRVAVGAPVAAIEAPFRRSLWWLLFGGGSVLALATLAAGWCGRQISKSLRAVAELAISVTRAEPIAPLQTRLKEVNAISQALSQAATDVARQTAGRNQAEASLRAETDRLDALNRVGQMISSELDRQALVQKVTDAGVELSGAAFGSFFYNVAQGGETLTLYTRSGVPREAFSNFPMPRGTHVFAPASPAGELRSPASFPKACRMSSVVKGFSTKLVCASGSTSSLSYPLMKITETARSKRHCAARTSPRRSGRPISMMSRSMSGFAEKIAKPAPALLAQMTPCPCSRSTSAKESATKG